MKKFVRVLFALIVALTAVSCDKNEGGEVTAERNIVTVDGKKYTMTIFECASSDHAIYPSAATADGVLGLFCDVDFSFLNKKVNIRSAVSAEEMGWFFTLHGTDFSDGEVSISPIRSDTDPKDIPAEKDFNGWFRLDTKGTFIKLTFDINVMGKHFVGWLEDDNWWREVPR